MKTLKYRINCKSFCLWTCLVALFFCVSSCKDDADVNKPLTEGGNAPGQISEIKAESTPGGSILTYTPPSDPNLAYVQAIVNAPGGKVYEYKASPYNARIEIIGLGSAAPQEVKLYSVSRSEKRSEPVLFTIHPLDPPFIGVAKTMKMSEDFGGVNIRFENISGAELAITLSTVNEKNEFSEYGTYYTNDKTGNYTWSNMDTEEKNFAVFIRDRWDNFSDTLFAKLTPLFEMEIDKKKFRGMILPGDAPIFPNTANVAMEFLWDGLFSSDFNNPYIPIGYKNMLTKAYDSSQPTWVTFDLGVKAQLSRVRFNHYYRYTDRAARRYEVWGCADTPAADGSWDNWVKLGEHEQIKPSGLPGTTYGAGDAEAWLNGDNIRFSKDLPRIRYIRIKCFENWQGDTNMCFAEATFWGAPEK